MNDRRLIQSELRRILRDHVRRGGCPAKLSQSISYSLLAPGKRIRPRLLLTTARCLGLKEKQVVAAAAAIEMVHCFSLIHDDLPCMDDDDWRRGRPSNHKKFGQATALLAGDALLGAAFAAVLDSVPRGIAVGRATKAVQRLAYANGTRGMIGGQAAEASLSTRPSLHGMRKMHALKTGALFEAAILMAADLAGISEKNARFGALQSFAHELGAAFQVVDDLEDAEADSPTSILFYRSPSWAKRDTQRRLRRAEQHLEKTLGKRANALLLISAEVGRKLA